MANGKKNCPGCNTELGLRTHVCPGCGFDFSAAKKEKIQKEPAEEILTPNEPKETDSQPIVVVPSKPTRISMADKVAVEMRGYVYTPPVEKTKREHAQEILSKGQKQASFMYHYAKTNSTWSHVDWAYVAEQLGVKKGGSTTEEQEGEKEHANTDQQNS